MLIKGALFIVILYLSIACTENDPVDLGNENLIDTEISFLEAGIGDPTNRKRVLLGNEGKAFFEDGYYFQYRLPGSEKANYLFYKSLPKKIQLPNKRLDIVLSNRPYNLISNEGTIGTSIYREDSVLWAKTTFRKKTKNLRFDTKRLDGRFIIQFDVSPEIKYYTLKIKEKRYDFDPFYEDEHDKWIKGLKIKQKSDMLLPIPSDNIVSLKTFFVINSNKLVIRLYDENQVLVFEWLNADPVKFVAESSSLLLRVEFNRSIRNLEISDVTDVDGFEVDQVIDINNSGD